MYIAIALPTCPYLDGVQIPESQRCPVLACLAQNSIYPSPALRAGFRPASVVSVIQVLRAMNHMYSESWPLLKAAEGRRIHVPASPFNPQSKRIC
jgi:hypothetical protein